MAKKLRFKMTCMAFPEQYDVFWGAKQCGYVRLRHGGLTVRCPDVGGELVYEAEPEGDGCFEKKERDQYLRRCGLAILEWIDKNQKSLPGLEEYRVDYDDAPNVAYELEDFVEW